MKKVRYAAGVIGAFAAVPALGCLAPPATAAVAQGPAVAGGKSVALVGSTANHCNARSARDSSNNRPTQSMRGYIAYSRDNGCVGSVVGHFFSTNLSVFNDRGYRMRIRYWDNGAYQTHWNSNGQLDSNAATINFRTVSYYRPAQQVCETIFHQSKLVAGTTVCEQTGY